MTTPSDFDQFYLETHPRLWAYLMRTSREPDLAEDIAQEAFVRLLMSRGASLPADDRRAYLFRIAENLLRDAGRRRVREQRLLFEASSDAPAQAPSGQLSRRVSSALNALSERERKLLWLAYVEKWKHTEIAGILGLAFRSVRVLLHRARRNFREHFEAEEQR